MNDPAMGTIVYRFATGGPGHVILSRARFLRRCGSWREYHGQRGRWKENGCRWFVRVEDALLEYLDELARRHVTEDSFLHDGYERVRMIGAVTLAIPMADSGVRE